MSNGGNPREPEIPSPDQHEVPDPGHRYDALQVLQTMMELQKDITMIATKTDRLITDVDKLDRKIDQVNDMLSQKVDRISGTLTWARGFGVAAVFLIPICAGFVWWLVGAKIEQIRDEIFVAKPPISQPPPSPASPPFVSH
jgi:hypothetical protein